MTKNDIVVVFIQAVSNGIALGLQPMGQGLLQHGMDCSSCNWSDTNCPLVVASLTTFLNHGGFRLHMFDNLAHS